MTTPSTLRKTEWRAKTDAGLRHIKGRWVSREDYERLQPAIDAAASRAQGDDNGQ